MNDELLTAAEAAEYLGMSKGWVLKKFRAGELPGVRMGAGKYARPRFWRSELDAWLEEHRSGPTPNRQLSLVR